MIKPDVCLVWPKHVDYPLFRRQLSQMRQYFDNVYICMSEHYRLLDIEPFLREHLIDCTFVDVKYGVQDWRSRAVKSVLELVQSDYVFFLEQDFLFGHTFHMPNILLYLNYHSDVFVGYKEGERVHPAFAVVKRHDIHRTNKDFAAYPDQGLDHFGVFFQELCNVIKFVDIRELGFQEGKDFYHMAGLTQNYNCFLDHQPFYKPNEFLTYNEQSLVLGGYDKFVALEKDILEKHQGGDSMMIKSFFTNI